MGVIHSLVEHEIDYVLDYSLLSKNGYYLPGNFCFSINCVKYVPNKYVPHFDITV